MGNVQWVPKYGVWVLVPKTKPYFRVSDVASVLIKSYSLRPSHLYTNGWDTETKKLFKKLVKLDKKWV